MTVSSSTNKASYSGNGSLTTFAYNFKVFDQDDLTVILRASNGTETVQTITTHYTVTGVGNVSGGNVVFGTAPASGITVVILREMDLEQGLDLVPNDPFPAQSLENSLDKLTFMVQQHDEQLGRTIQASRTNVITGSEFVISAADRANKVFAFDSSGDVSITQELGTFRGDWAASTAYVERDLVKDTTTNNVFIVNSAHTSSGSLPLTTNTNSSKYEKIIDITNPPGDLTVGGNISTSGSVTAGSFVIGSADINENDLEAIDSIVAGTVAASKAVVVDVNKDISSFRNLTATGDITFGGLSDGTITVTDILDEDNMASNSATALSTQQSIKAYVDSQVGSFDTLAEILANGSTTGGTNLSVSTGDDIKFADGSQAIFGAGDDLRINHTGSNSYISDLGTGPLFIGGNDEVSIMNGQLNEYKIKAETNGAVTLYYDNAVKMATTNLGIDVTGTITFDGGETTADLYFGDNDKAIFGAGSDLQIYHDGSSSFISDQGTGNLKILAQNFIVSNPANTETMIAASPDGAVSLYYDAATKLATTSTGIDVTGTVTADGLTVDGNVAINNVAGTIFTLTDTSNSKTGYINWTNDAYDIFTNGPTKRLTIAGTGDISFYEDQGITPKFFWDASAESLGIGTSSPSRDLHINGTSSNAKAFTRYTHDGLASTGLDVGYSSGGYASFYNAENTAMVFSTNATERLRITSAGLVGIGTSSPVAKNHLKGSGTSGQVTASWMLENSSSGTAGMDITGAAGASRWRYLYGGGPGTGTNALTEAMCILTEGASAGSVGIGTTASVRNTSGSAPRGQFFNAGGSAEFAAYQDIAGYFNRLNNDGDVIQLRRSGSTVGSISVTTSATSYNTSSDYRLKTDAQPMTGASARVQALNPVNFEWIADGTRVDGFLAHEAQEIVPEAVTGTKDAMRDEEYEVTPAVYEDVVIPAVLDEDGNELEAERTEQQLVTEAVMGTRSVPDYQGIDQSKLVPLLTAALQEALTKIDALETRITALEG